LSAWLRFFAYWRMKCSRFSRCICLRRNTLRSPSSLSPLQLHAGDIGAVVGLKLARTGDTLCSSPRGGALKGLQVPPCVFGLRLEPYSNADLPALEIGLQRLLREDPSLQLVMDNECNSITLRGMGELHLEVALHRLCHDFGCKVTISLPAGASFESSHISISGKQQFTACGV
jgi:elongation factor G